MTPVEVALAWLALGAVATVLAHATRRPSVAALGPVTAGLVTLLTRHQAAMGPLVPGGGAGLSRFAVGLLLVGGVAMGLVMLRDPERSEGTAITAGALGGLCVLMLAPDGILEWGVVVVAATAVLGVRWLVAAPGPVSLAFARVAGVGALALVGALLFGLGAQPNPTTPAELAVTTLVGWLLLLWLATVLGLMPIGGWAAGALRVQRPAERALWLTLLVPATTLSVLTLMPELTANSGAVLGRGLLDLGLATALWHGVWAVLEGSERRAGRIVLADAGLIATGLGAALLTFNPAPDSPLLPSVPGVLLLLLLEMVVAPLVLPAATATLRVPHRIGWLMLSGLPMTAGFWARLLILEGCARVGLGTLPLALVAVGLLGLAGLRGLSDRIGTTAPSRSLMAIGAAGVASLAVVALSLLPTPVTHLLLGGL